MSDDGGNGTRPTARRNDGSRSGGHSGAARPARESTLEVLAWPLCIVLILLFRPLHRLESQRFGRPRLRRGLWMASRAVEWQNL